MQDRGQTTRDSNPRGSDEAISASEAALGGPCRLCGDTCRFLGHQSVLRRYNVKYFECVRCELIQTEAPYWLEAAYAETISSLDTGAIARNLFTASVTMAVARLLQIDARAHCLDWGGGHGVFTRIMRDLGLEFFCYDRYASNLYARGFAGDPRQHYQLTTCFEVFEHLADVRTELAALFAARPNFVLISTELHRGYQSDWWYLSPEVGQHIALFSARTLAVVAEMFAYDVVTGPSYSLFVARSCQLGTMRRMFARALLRHVRVAHVLGGALGALGRVRSKTWSDHIALRDRAAGPDR